MRELAGKCVFVTGGGSGIGREMARSFFAAGCRVVAADIDHPRAVSAAREIDPSGTRTHALHLDVASPASWRNAVQQVEIDIGAIDILCNNAGIGSARKPLGEIDDADWHRLININLHGVFNGINVVLPRMKKKATPSHIVNTASILAHFACPNASDYVSAKYAVLGLSEALRMELAGTHIGVSVLCPGLVETAIGPPRGHDHTPSVMGTKPRGIGAQSVAEAVVEAVTTSSFYIFTHPEYEMLVKLRGTEIATSLQNTSRRGETDDVSFLGRGMLSTISAGNL
jgi:NAD(P)-dependent dehydrogenase (short-subunit alcohol dehydrogenase family)